MRQVKAHAGQVREQAIAQLLSADDIRSATRESMRQIDKACHEIEKRNGELSIKHIVDVMERLYPDNHPAINLFATIRRQVRCIGRSSRLGAFIGLR
ncbi:hypothetical protein JG536_28150 (plasmid) [Burkholderia ambifaria]|uniref:hypothetical protein n=1 Tax=Burkholderia ambifaria TaxID=152480 RepID=UPI0018F4AED6|nr:hypothetical protein [Burkholderia ambifaria]QQK01071.1 hypothetical protein JG536_28150 [Burkholderia ambifaria]